MPLRAFLAGAIILIFIICAAFSVPVEALQLTQMSAQPTGQDGQEVQDPADVPLQPPWY